MHFTKLLPSLSILLVIGSSSVQVLAAEPPKELANARIDDIAANYTSFTVRNCPGDCDAEIVNISVRDTGAQMELKNFKKGDHVSLQITNDNNQPLLQTISIRALPVSSGTRMVVLGITAAVCFFLAALLTKFHPLRLVVGQDGRYSNSKFQMAIWFSVVIITYIAAMYLRAAEVGREFLGGINIPQNLFLLSGMSALTFGGAKGITASKVQSAIQAGLANPKPSAAAPSFWNLVQDDKGLFDIGDFQMLVITLLAVGMYLVLVFNFLGSIEMRKIVDLPNLDTTILAAFGLGQGAYLAKKAAGTPGQS
jgi:hypothetical protein